MSRRLVLDHIVDRVAAHRPTAEPTTWASTALVLGDGAGGPSALLIRRVKRDGDRWSGDMALPGGKVDPTDASPEAAAARETAEEVGISLGVPLARLDDLRSRAFSERIAITVFALPGTPEPTCEPSEVAEAVWLPVDRLAAPESRTWHRYGGVVPFRSITVDDYMIWGLTRSILSHFFAVAGLD